MKRVKKLWTSMLFCLLLFLAISVTGITAYANSENENVYDLAFAENISREIFGDLEIESSEYIYNLNDDPDYIYVNFVYSGYAVYFKDTMELMEYSPVGNLPYGDKQERKYYAGPSNYYYKDHDLFVNAVSGNDIYISDYDAENYSEQVHNSLLQNSSKSSPPFEWNNIISPNLPGAVATTYITNYEYFTPTKPMHGENVYGTCGSVATQLLLSYNNYYNDRRIISPEYLNGGWNNSKGNNDIYDSANYSTPYYDPNACVDPCSLTSQTAGTNDGFYKKVIGIVEPGALSCYDAEESGDNDVCSHKGSYLADVKRGLFGILAQNLPANEYLILSDSESGSAISSSSITAEIDSGRPLIIGMQESLGGINHWVVGFGYQDYTYPTGHEHAGETYSGYIVHTGWGNRYVMWVNKAWCNSYISLRINHTHDMNIDTGKIINNEKREYRCEECGYRDVKELFALNSEGDTILGCNYDIEEEFVIPSKINGITVKRIGNNAFENQTKLTKITLPSTITSIGGQAFKGCTSLTNISIPSSVNYIGDGAFENCNNLNITVAASNPYYTAKDNILYNKDKTKIVATGKIASNVFIPNTVTEIAPYAFKSNGNLYTVKIEGAPTIGNYAFADCANLSSVFCYSHTVPAMSMYAFLGNDFILSVPHSEQSAYRSAFAGYTNSVDSPSVNITLMKDGEILKTFGTKFGATISELETAYKEGHTFGGWYDNTNYTGTVYANGGYWDTLEDMTVYAKFTPQTYHITFSGDGSEGLSEKEVTYGEPIGELYTPIKPGFTFTGWKDSYGVTYTEDMIWDKTSNQNVTSSWQQNEYNIIFDGNGGVASCDSMPVNYNSVVNEFATAYKRGYTFKEWNTQADGKGETVTTPYTHTIEGDKTLYAQYEAKIYSVTFNRQEGSGGDSGVDATFDSPMPYREKPSRNGYDFKGYFEYPNGKGKQYYDADMASVNNWDIDSEESVTIYAFWEGKRYEVTFNSQGGTGGTLKADVQYGSTMPPATKPLKTGYTFMGYFAQPEGVGVKYYDGDMVSQAAWNIVGDETIYAHWTATVYLVLLDQCGGVDGDLKVDTTFGSPMPSATAPRKDNFEFQGYFSERNGRGTKYYNSDMSSARNWDIADERILYAHWLGVESTITFNKGAGYGGSSSVKARYDSPMPTSGVTAPSRGTCYVFQGYFDERDGRGTQYYNSDMTSKHNWDKTQDTTLYAYWKGKSYSIVYNNLNFMGQTAGVYLDDGIGGPAPNYYEYGNKLDIGRVSAHWSPQSPYSPHLIFLGWYTDMTFTQKATSISATQTGNVYWYAKWRYDYTNASRTYVVTVTDSGTMNQPQDQLSTGLTANNLYRELKKIGIEYLMITLKIKIREVDDGYQHIIIYNQSDSKVLWSKKIDHKGGSSPSVYAYNIKIKIDDIADDMCVRVRYSATGAFSDTWECGPLYYEMMYVVNEEDIKSPEFVWHKEDPFPNNNP